MQIPSWLTPPNFLAYMSEGANAGLSKRRAADEESQFAAKMAQEGQQESDRQDDAAQRLKLSYDSLAQQHDLSQQEIAARAMQGQAAMALHQQGQDSLNQWRQQQEGNQKQRLSDQEQKTAAAAVLKEKADKDINAFWSDLPEKGLSKSLQDHPFAASEPGIRSAAAQKLINPKADPLEKDLTVEYNLPDSAGKAKGPLPLMQKQFGTNLPPTLQPAEPATLQASPSFDPLTTGASPGNASQALLSVNAAPATKYQSAQDVKAAFKSGDLSKEDAIKLINEQFPDALQAQ